MNFLSKFSSCAQKEKRPAKSQSVWCLSRSFSFTQTAFRFQDAVLLFLPHVLQSFDANKSYTFSVFPVAKE